MWMNSIAGDQKQSRRREENVRWKVVGDWNSHEDLMRGSLFMWKKVLTSADLWHIERNEFIFWDKIKTLKTHYYGLCNNEIQRE